MKTMSHTPEQRKAWHAGKRRDNESSADTLKRCWKVDNYIGALTPAWLKRGLFYAPLPIASRRR